MAYSHQVADGTPRQEEPTGRDQVQASFQPATDPARIGTPPFLSGDAWSDEGGANDGGAEQDQTVLEQRRKEQRNAKQGLPAVPQMSQQPRHHQHGKQRVDRVFPHILGVPDCFNGKRGEQGRQKRGAPSDAETLQQEEHQGDGQNAGRRRHDSNAEGRALDFLDRVQDQGVQDRRGVTVTGTVDDFRERASRNIGRYRFVMP